jgi:hypothetical protein
MVLIKAQDPIKHQCSTHNVDKAGTDKFWGKAEQLFDETELFLEKNHLGSYLRNEFVKLITYDLKQGISDKVIQDMLIKAWKDS